MHIVGFNATQYHCKNADTTLIKSHFTKLTKTPLPRNSNHIEQLNNTANYIAGVFRKYADTVYFQEYKVGQKTYKNVIASFGYSFTKRLIIGAHYDVCEQQEGADDNASGIVGLLELARLLKGEQINKRIDLVAYTLEEPPYFRTEQMGSYIHAKHLKENNVDVVGMICLEMIGYFKEEKGTQDYPIGLLKPFYGSRGNYIAVIKKTGGGKFARKFARRFDRKSLIKTKKLTAPARLPGIDFSDHLNYWKFDYSALMITDTAFYRNKNYHKTTDTMDTLDFNKMALVITSLFMTLTN